MIGKAYDIHPHQELLVIRILLILFVDAVK